MTAQRSMAEVDRLVMKGTVLRNKIYRAVKGRPGFDCTHPDFWPESWEKEAAERLWEAHLFSLVKNKSAEQKYNLLREAIAYAEEAISNQRTEAKL